MKIVVETDKDAHALIEVVCGYLKAHPKGVDERYELTSAELARDLCGYLLEASSADGMGGCPLCQL